MAQELCSGVDHEGPGRGKTGSILALYDHEAKSEGCRLRAGTADCSAVLKRTQTARAWLTEWAEGSDLGYGDVDIEPFSPEENEVLAQVHADLWAQAYGFADAEDMKAEGERMEREYCAQMAGKHESDDGCNEAEDFGNNHADRRDATDTGTKQ